MEMKTITTAWLKRRGACADQVELFGRTFGAGCDLTAENIRTAADAGIALDWLADVVLPARAWARYDRARATASSEYHRARASAWDEYERVRATALAEYRRAAATALIGLLWPEAAGEGRDE